MVGATGLLVTLIGREFYPSRLATIGGLLFACSPLLLGIDNNASADQLTILPATAALYAMLHRRAFLAGVLIVTAAMTKTIVAPEALLLLCFSRIQWRSYLAGCLLVVTIVLLLFTALGILTASYDALVTFNSE